MYVIYLHVNEITCLRWIQAGLILQSCAQLVGESLLHITHTNKKKNRLTFLKLAWKRVHLPQSYVTATCAEPIMRIYVIELTAALCCCVLVHLLTPSAFSQCLVSGDKTLFSEDHRGPDGFWIDCFRTFSSLIFLFLLQLRLPLKERAERGIRCANRKRSIHDWLPIKRQ